MTGRARAARAWASGGPREAAAATSWWSRGWSRGRGHRWAGLGRTAAGGGDAGMTTAEYAVGTLAACALAAVLYKVVTSGAVSGALQQLIVRALHATF
ncbi:DUF4244 domain-containing protein [Streptomyces cinnamoneus]|uniref:DUF4244 domain-containing protein n=1 Tax=Streptomyces cinnamoneus TaxID=53446 RepID=UPI003F57229E